MMTAAQRKEMERRLAKLEAGGHARPRDLWTSARSPTDVLHGLFLWDDKRAGALYRDDQARGYITSIRSQITTETRTLSSVTYVRDPRLSAEEQGYVSLTTLRADPALAREALLAEFSRIESLLERARELAVALSMESEIDPLLASVSRVRAQLIGEATAQ